ncbi:MAG: EI24 domain-containing protein [Candidatus Sericytochromatia bacterium]
MNNRCTSCGVIVENSELKCIRCDSVNNQNNTTNFIKPLFYIFDGIKELFKSKKLLKLSIIPLIITTIFLVITYILAIYFMISGLNTYLPVEDGGTLKTISKFSLAFIGTLTLMIISLFLFLPLSSLICIPFNDVISQETEKMILGEDSNHQEQNIINEVKVGIKEAFKLLFVKAIVLFISLPVLLIPVIGQITFFFILALITSIDFLDIILSRKKYTLVEKLSFLNKNSTAFILFSIPIMLLFWIPIVQILIIPAGTIGGTKLFLNSKKS